MPDAPRKYHLINDAQLQAAKKHWPQVTDHTWVLVLKRAEEPLVLNQPPHRGVGFVSLEAPPESTTRPLGSAAKGESFSLSRTISKTSSARCLTMFAMVARSGSASVAAALRWEVVKATSSGIITCPCQPGGPL